MLRSASLPNADGCHAESLGALRVETDGEHRETRRRPADKKKAPAKRKAMLLPAAISHHAAWKLEWMLKYHNFLLELKTEIIFSVWLLNEIINEVSVTFSFWSKIIFFVLWCKFSFCSNTCKGPKGREKSMLVDCCLSCQMGFLQ